MRATPEETADHLAEVSRTADEKRRQNVEQSALALAKEAMWRWLHAPRNRRERRDQMFGGHGRQARMTPLTADRRRRTNRARRLHAMCGDYSVA